MKTAWRRPHLVDLSLASRVVAVTEHTGVTLAALQALMELGTMYYTGLPWGFSGVFAEALIATDGYGMEDPMRDFAAAASVLLDGAE